MHFFIITTMIFLFLSHATLTLSMAADSSVSIPEDNGFNSAIELPQSFDAVDASEFVHNTPSVDLNTTQERDLENSKNDGPDNDDSEDVGFTPTLSRRAVPPLLVCETSEGSPWVKDIRDVADWMMNPKLQGEWDCKQRNPVKSRCNRVQWSGTAEAALCGRHGLIVSCRILAMGIRAVVEHCTRDGRAGGRLIYDTIGASLIVYNTSKL